MLRSIFRAQGTDTIPAMLTPGEGVLNLNAMDIIGRDGLRALNAGRLPGAQASLAAATPPPAPVIDNTVVMHVPPGELTRAMTAGTPIVVRTINNNHRGTRTELFGRGKALGGSDGRSSTHLRRGLAAHPRARSAAARRVRENRRCGATCVLSRIDRAARVSDGELGRPATKRGQRPATLTARLTSIHV